MLLHQHPALDYITWQGLVIIDGANSEDDPTITQTLYTIEDGKSCKKYIYWDRSNPYVLRDSNEWVNSTSTIKLIYINDNGEGTEVPQTDIDYYYSDKSSGSGGGLLIGKMMGEFDEIDGKFMSVIEDIDGIRETLGINGEAGADGSIVDRLNQVEKTVEGNTTTISEISTLYNNDKVSDQIRDRMNIAFLDIMQSLASYEDVTSDAMKDLEINDEERANVNARISDLNEKLAELNECHELIRGRIDAEENADDIAQLDRDNLAMNNAINNLNSNVTNVISSNTVPTSAITTVLSMFALASTRIKDYQQTLRDINILGLGGVVTSNIQTVRETATEYSRTVSSLETVVNGENGLTTQVANNSTAINQNAETIRLSCMQYDMTTAEVTVGDNLIKLDAGKVLMTGTLTWDSLDDEARTNLKGEDGTNATAEYVMLTGDQIFKYDTNGNPENLSITLRADVFNVTNPTYTWSYKQQNSTEYVTLDNTFLIYTLTHDNPIWGGNNSITIRVVVGWSGSDTTVSDEMTIVKLYDGVPGVDGNNAQYVKIIGDQYFKYGDDITEEPTPASITLTAESFNITSTNSHWYYKDSNEVWQELTAYAGQNTITINHSDDVFVERYATIRYSIGTVYDIFTLVKLVDGADGYTIILSNENHSVPCEADGTYDSSALDDAYTTISVFKGTNEISFNLTKVDTGCTSTYNTSTRTLQITRLNENKATVDLSIVAGGQTFRKTMTITKALRGQQGLEGNGLEILGEFDSVSDLPANGNPGDAYMINGLIYIWSSNTNSWGDGVSIRGEQGLPGTDGVDGQTTYLHIKYSNDGLTFTGNNGEDLGDWMGQYVDFVIDDSPNFDDYRWMKIVGEDGEHGIVANLTNDSHIIPINSDGTYGADSFNGCASTIELSYNGNLLTTGVTYSYSKSDSITGTFSNGTYTVTNLTEDTGYVDLRATFNGVTYTKRFTVARNVDGITYYTWIRYADDENGTNISDDPTGKAYIGLGYNKLIEQESDNPAEYMWSKIMGDKGDTGEPGVNGVDGTTYYTWIKYSDNSTGNPCYDTPISTTAYIGIAVNQTTPVESNDYTLYTWSKFKGEDGTSVKILGTYGSESELNSAHPSGNNEGDGYIIDGDLYVWTGSSFENVGKIQGDNGKTSYFHVKYSNDGGTTFTSNSGEDVGIYMGTYVDFEEADSMDVNRYTWVLVKGTDGINGADGVDGQDGVSILWQGTLTAHPSNPQNGWAYYNSTDGKSYTYRDGAWYQMTVDGRDGVDGNDGRDGTDGLSIDYRGEMSSPPSNPIRNWAYRDSDNGIVYIYTGTAWEVMTYDGTDGADGTNGTNGVDGTDGLSVFITYHDNLTQPSTPTGNGTSNGWHTNCTDAVVWMSQKVAMTSTEGTWGTPVKIKGQDGKDGTSIRILGTYDSESALNSAHPTGNTEGDSYIVNGNLYVWNGSSFSNTGKFQGDSSYLHIKYSNDGGNTFTANNGESVGEYIGIYTDNIEQDSTNVADYKWSKLEGTDGADAYTVNLSNDSHVFTADANGNIISDTSIVIVVSAYRGTTAVTPTIGTLPSATGITLRASGVNITVTVTNSLGQSGVLRIPITVGGNQFIKEFSYAKVTCGADGSDGADGSNGADAYTVLLTNESDIFVCENNGNITSAITKRTNVLAYRGTTAVTPTIGTLPSVSGLTLSRSGTTITIVANTGTSLASSGSFDIPITVDGILFTKTFSWAKSFKGANGADGADGSMAELPNWIQEWDSNKTTINGTTVLAPKIFAGSVSGSVPTGVAIGTNVFGTSGTYSNISGIAGYKNGTKTYHLSTDGNILVGNSSGRHISWDGSTLEVVADKIMLGNSSVASQNDIDTAMDNLNIGGSNFVRNSDFSDSDNNWSLNTSGASIDEGRFMNEGGASLKISRSGLSSDAWTGATQTIMANYVANEEFTLSFCYYAESKSSLDGNICLEIKGTNSSGSQVGVGTAYITPSNVVTGAWRRVYATVSGTANLTNVFVFPYINRNGTVWITNIQVEKGNKVTDWSPNYYDNLDSLSRMQSDIIQLIEDDRTYLQIDDNGVSIVSQGQNVAIKTEGEIDAIVEEFNNRFTTLENGEGFAMLFDQKYAEYGVGEAVSTTQQITDHIDFSSGSIKLYGDSTNFSLTIAQDKMSFQQSGYDIAWMSTDTLYIRDGEFTNSLRLGNFKWIPRENGNLSFIHI